MPAWLFASANPTKAIRAKRANVAGIPVMPAFQQPNVRSRSEPPHLMPFRHLTKSALCGRTDAVL